MKSDKKSTPESAPKGITDKFVYQILEIIIYDQFPKRFNDFKADFSISKSCKYVFHWCKFCSKHEKDPQKR